MNEKIVKIIKIKFIKMFKNISNIRDKSKVYIILNLNILIDLEL